MTPERARLPGRTATLPFTSPAIRCAQSIACAVLILGCLASITRAQETGIIVGHVVDQTGGVLPGVTIELATSDAAPVAVQSDARGRYRFDGIATRSAALTFRLINFAILRRTVGIAPGTVTTADAVMTLPLDADVAVTGTATFRNVADVDNPAEKSLTAAYVQSEIEWTRVVRTTVGLRADLYTFDVTSNNPVNSGSGSDAMVSPKFTAVFGPWKSTELYANAGMGYHSNDARGAVITVDPKTGEAVERVAPLVRATGAELGVRTVAIRGLQSTVSLWYLGLDSERLFVGDPGTTEAGRPSRRVGIEWANYWRPRPWVTADLDVSFSRARFMDDDPAGDRIPGALDRVISAGVTVDSQRSAFVSLRLRHVGPRALVDDDASVTSPSTMLWNGEFG